jgi:hypothetical protein
MEQRVVAMSIHEHVDPIPPKPHGLIPLLVYITSPCALVTSGFAPKRKYPNPIARSR